MENIIVVVGGGYAGVLAALRAKRRLGERGRVTLVSATDSFVDRIRLHERAARDRVVEHPYAHLLAGTGIHFIRATVDSIDTERRRVRAGELALPYDKLILAVGSRVDRDRVPGARAHALALEPDLVDEVRARAAAAGRIVVCGGGATGIEAASELAQAYPAARVELVTEALGERATERDRAYLQRALAKVGVIVREGARIEAIEPGAVILVAGERIPFDLCVWAGGFLAAPLARAIGLRVNDAGQALVDPLLRASAPDVYAAGDTATPLVDPGSPTPMGCKSAMPMAAHAAENAAAALLGRPERPFDWRHPGICISIGRRDGIIQFMRMDSTPSGWRLTGRIACFFKEVICRIVVGAFRFERGGVGYRWFKTGRAPRLLQAPR